MLNRLLVVAKLPGYQFGADLAAVDAGARRSSFQAASDAVRELASPGVETARLATSAAPPGRAAGWLSKKAPEHLLAGVSTGWSKRYFCLRAPGELAYFKHEGDDEPVGVVDLRLAPGKRPYLAFDLRVCGAFAKHDKGAKSDPARFSVDVGDHSVKLKAPTAQDARRRAVAGLRKWQDHILLGTAASMV
ncbi:LMBR1-like membrane protein [Aureococcus anophagefferens]|uniref:LMBR1-like membrane protein n=1 Tax=Aureococcus anophagefferens TaxID=44056 RepID=A0ABR1FT80_AURAN